MATKKMTKKEMFAEIRNIITDLTPERGDILEFIDKEVELLNKKSASKSNKPTKTQLENEVFKEKILSILAKNDTLMTIKEICAEDEELTGLSNQKMNHLLTSLRKNEKKVRREYIKRVAHFALGTEEEPETEETTE